ncbi:dnaJ homolog subfamily B member 2 isoform X3 [Papaver somniferum]|uniref:dnaJ homolog subfamily B member 2 isoform X3 n=1 Tax=Papaver somniferum TaxID=3469 RepID=UPI000E702560|nr:dnaJ homolog subfamily B member 2 isoform X3 [Papaver somniferum]
MQGDEARELLGLSSTSHPTPSQVKAAYKRKAWESHPDRFPANEKLSAETKFKLISEAYSCLKLGIGQRGTNSAYARVVRTGSPNVHQRSKSQTFLVKAPFFLLIIGTVALGGMSAARAYKRQEKETPSYNPFLP